MNSPLPTALSIRNNCMIMYKDMSYSDHSRNGCKKSLSQNQKTEYKSLIKQMNKVKEVKCIDSYSKSLTELHTSHANEMAKKGIQIKPFGTVSNAQLKRIRCVIENVINTVFINEKPKNYKEGNYVTFLTLTLPSKQIHTDTQINKILVRFLENLKQSKSVVNYVWKAEPMKNGNLHYHIILDKWIDKHYINNRWNKQINKLGYVDRSTSLNPPSTEIHSLKKVRNAVSYIQKYMTKLEKNKRVLTAKIWGCSRSASKLTYPKVLLEGSEYRDSKPVLDSQELKQLKPSDYITLFTGKVFEVVRKLSTNLWNRVKNHYKELKSICYENVELQLQIPEAVKSVIQPLPDYKQLQFTFPMIGNYYK